MAGEGYGGGMEITLALLVLLAAFGCAALATFDVPDFPRWRWLPAAVALFLLWVLLGGMH